MENSDAISSKTVASLLMDLHSNQIALKGCAFFVITYRFLGTVCQSYFNIYDAYNMVHVALLHI